MKTRDNRVGLFILGVAKCGTTTLNHYLNQHPSILMAQPKEPLFFEAEYESGNEFYLDKYFSSRDSQALLGDARHRNLYLPFVLPRIKSYVQDDAKFLVILRNPVARAYSHWWHNYSWRDEKRNFEDAIKDNLARLETGPFFEDEREAELYKSTLNYKTGFSPYVSYVDSGFYADQIQRFIDTFGADRIKILFLEDLIAKPTEVMQTVFDFLDLPPTIELNHSVQNEANSKLGKTLLRTIKNIPGRKMIPPSLRSYFYKSIRRNFKNKPKSEETISLKMKQSLTELYLPHVEKIETMTGRDLSDWK